MTIVSIDHESNFRSEMNHPTLRSVEFGRPTGSAACALILRSTCTVHSL